MGQSDLLWLDSDVILDWLARRQPWDAAACELIERSIIGNWKLCFSPLTLANIHYVYRKHAGTSKAMAAIKALTMLGSVAEIAESHVHQALATGRSDFEDEIQIASAGCVQGLTAIITRNLVDYAHSPVPAMTADHWLAQHPVVPES